MCAKRFLVLGSLLLVLANNANAQYVSPYNSGGGTRSSSDVAAERAANSQRAYQERLERDRESKRQASERAAERKNTANEQPKNGGTKTRVDQPVETPEEKARRIEWDRRPGAAKEKEKRMNEVRNEATAAVKRNDAEGLVVILKSNGFKELQEADPFAWQNIRGAYAEDLITRTKDSVQHFKNLSILFSEAKDPRDVPTGFFSRDIDEMDFVELRLMVLMGNYNEAIKCLRNSSYYGVKQFKWTKSDEDMYPAGQAKSKQAYSWGFDSLIFSKTKRTKT